MDWTWIRSHLRQICQQKYECTWVTNGLSCHFQWLIFSDQKDTDWDIIDVGSDPSISWEADRSWSSAKLKSVVAAQSGFDEDDILLKFGSSVAYHATDADMTWYDMIWLYFHRSFHIYNIPSGYDEHSHGKSLINGGLVRWENHISMGKWAINFPWRC